MTDPAPTPAPRRPTLRRALYLLAAALVVAVVTPIAIITLTASDFVTVGGRLLSPWSVSVGDLARQPATGDPSVTPEAAGEALRRISGSRGSGRNITMREAVEVAMPSLDSAPAGSFADARYANGGAVDGTRLPLVARRRLSSAERAYLADVAASPFWKEWDLLASAPSLDILAARVELPFGEHATAAELPLLRLGTLTAAARLTGARAAHFIAAGRRDSAEAAVHATLSVGLLLDREATTILEAWLGRRLVYTAATLSNRLRGDTLTFEQARLTTDSTRRSTADSRAAMVALAADSTAHRAARFEALMNLGMLPCTNARELLLGFRSDVEGAFASAWRNLIRHPSDSALLALIESSAERSPDLHEEGFGPALFRGMAHVSSTVLFNKRIHGCAEMLPYLRML